MTMRVNLDSGYSKRTELVIQKKEEIGKKKKWLALILPFLFPFRENLVRITSKVNTHTHTHTNSFYK